MATVTHREKTGEREFRVPIAPRAFPDWPFTNGGELIIRNAAGDLPAAVLLRLYPTAFEFGARLQKLVAGTPLEAQAFELASAGQRTQPVILFQGNPDVVSRVSAGLKDLADFERFLSDGPALFDIAEYRFVAIEFEDGEIPEA